MLSFGMVVCVCILIMDGSQAYRWATGWGRGRPKHNRDAWPFGKSCTDQTGAVYKDGEVWTCAYGCNKCMCTNGAIASTAMYCDNKWFISFFAEWLEKMYNKMMGYYPGYARSYGRSDPWIRRPG